MENIVSTMQRRHILFLISLPQTPEFEKDREDVKECLNELRKLQVDVREHIEREDLANANCYDIVIVVAHHDSDNDALILANGTMKMSDFVNCLPSDFKGVIDFSSCYSATAYKAIKTRCPQCKVQAALIEVRLLQRLIMYPSLVEYLNEDLEIDYHEAYKEVSLAFDEFAESKEKEQDEPEMTQLGQQMSSIYSPSEVKRDCPFQILVFFHYDSDKEVVRMKAQGWQTNALIRDDFEIPIEMKEGENITLTLSFDSSDNANIIENNGEYKKSITVKKEMVAERFKVTVLPDFKGSGFLANVEMAKEKEDEPFIRCAFNIDVTDRPNNIPADIVMEIPQQHDKPEKSISDIREADDRHTIVTTSNEELLPGEEKMKRIIESIKKVVADDLILKKQDWAAIYRILHEKEYYSLTMKRFVEIIEEQKISKRITPASDSNIRKVTFHNNLQYRHPYWKIEGMNDDEISRLANLARTFMNYCEG